MKPCSVPEASTAIIVRDMPFSNDKTCCELTSLCPYTRIQSFVTRAASAIISIGEHTRICTVVSYREMVKLCLASSREVIFVRDGRLRRIELVEYALLRV